MKTVYSIGILLVVLVSAGIFILWLSPSADMSPASIKFGADRYKEITNPSGFVNTEQISIGESVGKKVILVDFMTYSCINCQRTFPYLNAWYKKYKDEGLEIVGIHTPEFAFEKDIENVRKAMKQYGIEHPVVLDNNYATWNAYGNKYWPRKYLIDIHGNIVYDHVGEGAYEETEVKIKELLAKRASVLGERMNISGDSLAAEEILTSGQEAVSPEVYFGAGRNELLGNGKRFMAGKQTISLPSTFSLNTLYLGGVWNIAGEYAENVSPAVVMFKYRARDVYMVAGSGGKTSVEVLRDGAVVKTVEVSEEGLYTLIESPEYGEHVLELRIRESGLQAFTFTFG
ncbi:MAG: redoxin family protein [Candidatus Sungbacteria bacterium]|nr:redoxin family protein [Candidatus Sungbacteria bacterium]